METRETGTVRVVDGARSADDLGKLILRIMLAGLLLFHGIAKVFSGPGFIMDVVAKAGLPSALGYLVYVGEIVAPLLILFGIMTRAAALVVVVNMVVAVALVHASQFLDISKTGGWALELQAFYFFTALALVVMGAGRYSVAGINGRWN
ncbi:putative oxidoreductase [Noviherbaspirillum humi]|uniref:Putative oxidoreductase n=1 Tax=Noviherbaspirillum humi TaxID=1688639 RepID=A0A239L1N7_9BURK|nr:DoxX family protein [Noviherbaspirillum humi]SNT23763.1 putative oxidoreductase [Noviherbaspirillum humi]